MTKYFYIDRTLPKKRLTDAEMLEINGLYRTIGRARQALDVWWAVTGGLSGLALVLAAAPTLVLRRGVNPGSP